MSDADLVEHIRARRMVLAAQAKESRLQYADLEETIKQQQQSLALLQRNLDIMHGGLQELDALLDAAPGDDAGAPGRGDQITKEEAHATDHP